MVDKWQVVAAIDFGTHGTGWAWATVDAVNNDAHRRIINYKADHRGAPVVYPKNLSALFFQDGSVSARGFEARRRWVRARSAGESGIGYAYAFKMMLKPDAYHGDVPRGEGTVRLADPHDARHLITEYLRGVYQEVITDVGKRDYRPDHIRWCLTVPAIWEQADLRLMRQAAVEAGLPDDEDRLLLAIEPEAAALYCMVRSNYVLGTDDDREFLELNDGGLASRFMVVDCGGGTIDITAYKLGRAPDGSARLSEIGQPDGGKFGSEYTNAALIDDFLAARLGPDVIAKAKADCAADLQALQDQWEIEKANVAVEVIDGAPRIVDPVMLTVPPALWGLLDEPTRRSLADAYGSQWGVVVPEADVQKIFDTMLDPMMDVIRKQLRTMARNDGPATGPELLVVVGGFGRSEYLQARIAATFKDDARVLLAEDPAGAVMFGAVHYCYNPSVIRARRARFTLGYQASVLFRQGVDPLESQFAGDDNELYCTTRFHRLVAKGQSVEVDFARRMEVSAASSQTDSVVVRVFETPDDENPEWVTEANGKLLGTVTIDLTESIGVPRAERTVELYFYFGNAQTRVRAVNPRTGEEAETRFEIDYVR
ncbi:hypothetical protein [Actinosynnema sp. ALI-1.44]|uniref:hypothetical protein n=1 Tax=Actinosynnema sp. ALI-1.44 TaxID=1933779 RepID=UPI00097C80BF|nr:hypothetical protein [Actinosynnema sp. ALI-1.44]